MSVRPITFSEGEFYHIYNRGNSKQRIFHDGHDHMYFTNLLYLMNTHERRQVYDLKKLGHFNAYDIERKNVLVSIGAYCLMPNHFHILMTEKEEGGISKFMQKVSTAYAMYYNNKYERTGGLFEGKFKAQHADDDRYLKYLFSYIHLNPVKLIDPQWKERGIRNKKAVLTHLKGYAHSSYLDYLGEQRLQALILSVTDFPRYFPHPDTFSSEIFSWLSYGNGLKNR
ncbi:hypothetical protein FJY94_05350 [Candidatus Kaiserbacteria bacterium]|nr:hypothetical protein [Candidatus Kaiserbacteria bacterium]